MSKIPIIKVKKHLETFINNINLDKIVKYKYIYKYAIH